MHTTSHGPYGAHYRTYNSHLSVPRGLLLHRSRRKHGAISCRNVAPDWRQHRVLSKTRQHPSVNACALSCLHPQTYSPTHLNRRVDASRRHTCPCGTCTLLQRFVTPLRTAPPAKSKYPKYRLWIQRRQRRGPCAAFPTSLYSTIFFL